MASFCKIENNKVIKVVEVADNIATTEEAGVNFLKNLFNEIESNWIQTFNNGTRKHFASIGYTYNLTDNVFIPPKPYSSWILKKPEYIWESPKGNAPITYTKSLTNRDGESISDLYNWNEQNQTWELV